MMASFSVLAVAVALWAIGVVVTSMHVTIAWKFFVRRIARWHPVDRGRLALGAAALPALLPTLLIAVVLAPGLLGLLASDLDHCSAHPGHVHLCLLHPTAFLPLEWATVLGSWTAIGLAVGIAVVVVCRVSQRRSQAQPLAHLAALAGVDGTGNARIVELDRPLAITYGYWRPRTIVSRGLVDSVASRQLDTILAHEAEHARRRDPLRFAIARPLARLLPPGVRRDVLETLASSAEQACDEAACEASGDRLALAETILRVEALTSRWSRELVTTAVAIEGGSIAARVEALLEPPRARLRLAWLGPSTILLVCVLAASLRGLHHEAEHLLALLIGAV